MGMQQSLQTKILERMIGREKMKKLLKDYNGAKKKGGTYSGQRVERMMKPLTEDEYNLLDLFINNSDETTESLANQLNFKRGVDFSYRVSQIALRWAFQNHNIIIREKK